jgi:predicted Co/Zn/Cd cation transporter (cation efflux family)
VSFWSRHPLASTLQASLYWGALITACEMVVALVAGSSVLTLDGLYASMETVLSAMFVWSTRKLRHPDDPLPEMKTQNLLIRGQSVLMLGICIWAIGDGIHGILHPEPTAHFDLCFGFTATAVVAEAYMVYWLWRRARKLKSPMIGIEVFSWAMDTWLDVGFLISFILGWWWQHNGTSWGPQASMYISPILTMALGVMLLRKPIATLRRGAEILVPQSATPAQL